MRRRLPACFLLAAACGTPAKLTTPDPVAKVDALLATYTTVRLDPDLSTLTANERKMLPYLIDAADVMNEIFWFETVGSRDSVMKAAPDSAMRRYVDINFGPWDRLNGNAPFVPGVGPIPPGENFYPVDMTKAAFDSAVTASDDHGAKLKSLYTLVRWGEPGQLTTVPYHAAFKPQVTRAANKLRDAAIFADDPGLKEYLKLRAQALIDDNYQASDLAWMSMKNNTLDIVIGPIETYDDNLFGYKAAHEAYVLIKDKSWSDRLSRYAAMLPDLQRGLPVPDAYKKETPGTDSDLNAYNVVYYAGQANAGGKTIAINLPNDEAVQLKKGTRRIQLENSMRAKFDRILMPVAKILIAPDQQQFLSFDAFFENTMFHEVAHGLGIKNLLSGKGTVREALKEQAGSLEEGKADVLGLYMVDALNKQGKLGKEDLRANYVTFLASIFRSVRFGAADSHGRANVARFNYFQQMGAFTRDSATGTYRVDFDKMHTAMDSLSAKILRFQGDGDYNGVVAWMKDVSTISPQLRGDLDRLATAHIPVDIIFDQGTKVLGLGQ